MDVKVEDGTAVVAVGDTLVALWVAPASLARWKWHVAQLEALADEHPGGILYVDLILPSSNPPDSTLRATMQADLGRLGPKLRKLVAVPLGSGLWLSIVDECLERVRGLATPATPSSSTLRGAISALFLRLGVKQSDAA